MPKAAVKRFRRLPEDEQSRVIEMAGKIARLLKRSNGYLV